MNRTRDKEKLKEYHARHYEKWLEQIKRAGESAKRLNEIAIIRARKALNSPKAFGYQGVIRDGN